MSFNNIAAKSVVNLLSLLPSRPTVCEMGNQTINLDDSAPWPAGLDRRTRLNGQSAERYYKALGFSQYVSLDVSDRHGSILADLNYPVGPQLPTGGLREFSLVTNNGTGEHLFDQAMVFRNCHDLCQQGGLMLHIMPLTNWVNHGFYSFQPLLYVDLAAVNGYRLFRLQVANRWGYTVDLPVHNRNACTEQLKPRVKGGPLHAAIKQVQDHERSKSKADFPNVMIIAVLGKSRADEFRYPVQGKYAKDIADASMAAEYKEADGK